MKICQGQRFRAKVDVKVLCLTSWSAPYTGSHDRVLPKGEIVSIGMDPPAWAKGVYLDPENYEQLHEMMVPAEERQQEFYCGYYLAISFDQLRQEFEPLPQIDPVGGGSAHEGL